MNEFYKKQTKQEKKIEYEIKALNTKCISAFIAFITIEISNIDIDRIHKKRMLIKLKLLEIKK